MKFTLSWLNEYLDTNASLTEISETLTDIGLEVESIENKAEVLRGFTVAEILSAEKHPDADKLQVCNVATHTGERIIVCGAPNARTGIKVALADIGDIVPNGGFKIKKSKIRGVESSGMMCSANELGLGNDHAGIIELPLGATIGDSIVDALGLDETVIEIAITPNRGDALGVYGIARDLAAAGIGTLKTLEIPQIKATTKTATNITLESKTCSLFLARHMTNLTNGESPHWLKERLESVGLRPISALVDITNYMTIAFGRPLHVYDADTLQGDITVRNAQEGEIIAALDDKTYTLNAEDTICVIADDKQALGIAGIVGGTPSSCTENTKNILLESAWFDPVDIANAGRILGAESDARYRFERTVDPEFTALGADIATQLILDICGTDTTQIGDLKQAGEIPNLSTTIDFSPADVAALGGVDIANDECETILKNLGFTVEKSTDNNAWKVTNPSYHTAMEHKADIVEEILRIKRYSSIPELPLPAMHQQPAMNTTEHQLRLIRRTLANRGMNEVYNFAFIPTDDANHFIHDAENTIFVDVINPISNDMKRLRTNLLPSMLSSAARNIARGENNLAFFESGNIFFGAAPSKQPLSAAGILTGEEASNWSNTSEQTPVFKAKSHLYAILKTLGVDVNKVKITTDAPSWYHPGKSARISLGGKVTLGYFGELHPATLRMFDIKQSVAAFEMLPENIPNKRKKASYESVKLSDYQAVKRDFAFVTDSTLPAGDLLNMIKSADKKLLKEVALFDVYEGKGMEEGKKSLAFNVTLQAQDRTLTEDEINKVSNAVIASAAKLGATLR